MSNLGKYQEIVEFAKASGGVDAMLEIVQKAAVAKEAPRLIGIGAAAGSVATAVVAGSALGIRHIRAKRGDALRDGEVAEQALRQAINGDARRLTDDTDDADVGDSLASAEERSEGEDNADRS